MKAKIPCSAVIALSVLATGCYSSWDLAPRSLESLNGYHYPEPQPRVLVDLNGEIAPFETGSQLRLGEMPKAEKFSAIRVNAGVFEGTTYPDGLPLSINLGHVETVHMGDSRS